MRGGGLRRPGAKTLRLQQRNGRADEGAGDAGVARALFSTQSTVSKAVGQLEAECGEALLERLGTGVRLTAAGAGQCRVP